MHHNKKKIVFLCIISNIRLILCRYLFNLKRKVKNKVHVEALIYAAYIVKEISTFISYHFEPRLRTKSNRVPRHDDGREMFSSGNLLIISHPGQSIPKKSYEEKIFV
jgi:hypothetical protein